MPRRQDRWQDEHGRRPRDAAAAPAGAAVGRGPTQQVGAALGVAVLSTLAAARTGHLLAAGRPAAAALTGGYHVAFATGAGLAAAALVLTAVMLRPADSASAPEPDRTAVAAGADL